MTAFVTAVEASGFSAAARRLGRSPASITRAVAFLEQRTGSRLLQRHDAGHRVDGGRRALPRGVPSHPRRPRCGRAGRGERTRRSAWPARGHGPGRLRRASRAPGRRCVSRSPCRGAGSLAAFGSGRELGRRRPRRRDSDRPHAGLVAGRRESRRGTPRAVREPRLSGAKAATARPHRAHRPRLYFVFADDPERRLELRCRSARASHAGEDARAPDREHGRGGDRRRSRRARHHLRSFLSDRNRASRRKADSPPAIVRDSSLCPSTWFFRARARSARKCAPSSTSPCRNCERPCPPRLRVRPRGSAGAAAAS